MTDRTFQRSPNALDEKLAVYWELVDQRERVETRIDAAKREKDTVNERIFRKVLDEYETELQTILQRLEPVKEELDAIRRAVDEEIRSLDEQRAGLDDELSELVFRHRVGEFDEGRLASERSRLQPAVDEIQTKRHRLAQSLESMNRRSGRDEAGGRSAVPERTEAASRYERAEATPRPATTPRTATPTAATSTRTSPQTRHDWTDADPLAALADHEHGEADTPSARQRVPRSEPPRRSAPAFPNLAIRSGAHAGKLVPLLPMTMSIGREHDNNVELKDPDVARYHARIVYQDGRFYVEDLDSSTGTWVNGERTRRSTLEEGDVIRIGETELVIEYA